MPESDTISDAAAAERSAIRAAMDRLIAGTPLRSNGKLTILALAAEAGLKRHTLTHKHTDLQDLFRARCQAADTPPPAHRKLLDENDTLNQVVVQLPQNLAAATAQLADAITQMHVLATENDQLRAGQTNRRHVLALAADDRSPTA